MHDTWIVYGGELIDVETPAQTMVNPFIFRRPEEIEIVGFFTDQVQATQAWKARAQQTVDNALMRFFVVGFEDAVGMPVSEPPPVDWNRLARAFGITN